MKVPVVTFGGAPGLGALDLFHELRVDVLVALRGGGKDKRADQLGAFRAAVMNAVNAAFDRTRKLGK